MMSEEQRNKINQWYMRALREDDIFSRYTFLWISFNSWYYAKYHERAVTEMAYVSGLPIFNIENPIYSFNAGQISKNRTGNINIRLRDNDSLNTLIQIKKRYNESEILTQLFPNEYNAFFQRNSDSMIEFQNSLKKDNYAISYLVNLSKNQDFQEYRIQKILTDEEFNNLRRRGVIIPLMSDSNLGQIISILSQIRNNLFHGSKTPGNENNIRIVCSAFNTLKYIMDDVINDYDFELEIN